MINYEFVNFAENLLEKVIDENKDKQTLFLFSTINSQKQALKIYQHLWDFSNSKFLTINEWKNLIFGTSYPILKDEKRKLAFYTILTNENKKFFKINNYFQSNELVKNFFDFWEEINEEMVNHTFIEKILESKETSQNWQKKTFACLKEIRSNYKKLLYERKLTDKIFLFKKDNLNLDFINSFDSIVVINQFYFTKLEKFILKQIQKEILIYYQVSENCVDKDNFCIIPDFSAKDVLDFRTEKIRIIQTPDSFSMISGLFKEMHHKKPDIIVDFQFSKQPYSSFFSPEIFDISLAKPFTSTSIFNFFSSFYELLSGIILDDKNNVYLIGMQNVLNAFRNTDFIDYFLDGNELKEKKNIQEKLLFFFNKLVGKDYKFIDLNLNFFKYNSVSEEIEGIFKRVFKKIEFFLNIESFSYFISQIASEEIINIEKIVNRSEAEYSNIFEIYYEVLADFQTLNEIDFLEDWNSFFLKQKNQTYKIARASGFLHLFLNFMKQRKISFNSKINKTKKIKIKSLQDTRNLQYDLVAILSVIEGILPAPPHTPFLFSENQRKQLGLKTYEDIKLLDKYYFLGLIAQTKYPIIFTCKNLEENIEESSFLEEIKIHFPDELFEYSVWNQSYRGIYDKFLSNSLEPLPDKSVIFQKDFFSIPFDRKLDFPDSKVALSFYRLERLKKNPFLFYIEESIDSSPRQIEIEEDFSEKLIGNLVHDFFTKNWHQILNISEDNKIKYNFLKADIKLIDDSIRAVLSRNEFKYKSPHSFSNFYFEEIFIPLLHECIRNFFFRLHNDFELSNKEITVYPELGSFQEISFMNLDGLNIFLRGRADLRIESKEGCLESKCKHHFSTSPKPSPIEERETKNFPFSLQEKGLGDEEKKLYLIFDYKTGKISNEKKRRYEKQLLFYELLYYILENPKLIEQIQSYIFFTEDKQLHSQSFKKKSKREIIAEFREEVKILFEELLINGFGIAKKIDPYDIIEITRKDLFSSKKELNR